MKPFFLPNYFPVQVSVAGGQGTESLLRHSLHHAGRSGGGIVGAVLVFLIGFSSGVVESRGSVGAAFANARDGLCHGNVRVRTGVPTGAACNSDVF